MKYDFDEVIDRKDTNSIKLSGYREALFANNPNIKIDYKEEDILKMWIADMAFATPDIIIDSIKNRLDKKIFGYTKILDEEYYKDFAYWCKQRYNWEFEKKQLFTSQGVVAALYELIEILANKNDKVLFCIPAYSPFKKVVDYNGISYETSKLVKDDKGKYKMDFKDIEQKCKDPNIKIFILCNPHNPTGMVMSKSELNKLARICMENDMWIISDEVHCDILRKGKEHIPLAKLIPEYDKLITCMSVSKTFNLAGMMISNLIIQSEELQQKWQEHHHQLENPLSVVAAQAAYAYGGEWVDQLNEYLDGNFKYLKKRLDAKLPMSNYKIPDATYLAWIDLSAYVAKDSNLTEYFATEAGLIIESSNEFVANGEGHIRINLACPRVLLEKAIDRIIEVLA